jgi:hypothetical protein
LALPMARMISAVPMPCADSKRFVRAKRAFADCSGPLRSQCGGFGRRS